MATKSQISHFEKQFGQAVADGRIVSFGDAAKFGFDWMDYAAQQLQAENERLRQAIKTAIKEAESEPDSNDGLFLALETLKNALSTH